MAPISEPFAIRWGFRVAVLLVCLNLVTAFWSPVEGLLFALICASFAWGIWRKQAWATIAAIGYQLIPLTELGSPANWPEGLIGEVLFLVLIHNLFALAFLLAAVALWRERSSRSAWVWMSLLAVFLIGVVSLKAFRTPVPSMEETLLVGDTVVVEHASWYLGRAPQNGDIIVFLYPMDRSKAFFKRVVGVPGDRLRIEGKQLYRNGNPVVEDYAVFKGRPVDDERFPPPAGAAPLGFLDGDGEDIFAPHIKSGEVVVPEGNYFVLGDNRNNSYDSRYWGFVPRSDIIGAPVLIFASYKLDSDSEEMLGRWSILNMRWSRLFKLVR